MKTIGTIIGYVSVGIIFTISLPLTVIYLMHYTAKGISKRATTHLR